MTNIKTCSIILIAILLSNYCFSQNNKEVGIYKSWYNKEINCTLIIKKKNSQLCDDFKVHITERNGKLKFYWYYWKHDFFHLRHSGLYLFEIQKLTMDTLIITQDSIKNNWEILPYSVMKFVLKQ